MTGYKKYNGLDYRPKFSSSEKGRSRETHYVLNKVFRTSRRKSNITLEDMNACAELLLGLIILAFYGLYKLVVWIYKRTKECIIRYRDKRRIQDKDIKTV